MTVHSHVFQFVALALFLVFGPEVRGVSQDELYDFGQQAQDRVLPKGDDSYSNVTLTTPINLFGETYNTLFVSTNGLVTFLTPQESFVNVQFPLNIPAIAPLYANADTSRKGNVYYRESETNNDQEKSLDTIRRLFPSLSSDYQPVSIVIVTWDQIGMYGDDINERGNTFQLAITTDGQITFIEFLYLDDGIQWIQAPTTDDSAFPSVRAQAGIISPDGKLFTLKGSGSDQVINLDKWTNGDRPGQYLYKIGSVDEDDPRIVEQPLVGQQDLGESLARTCSEGYVGCHTDAVCNDSPSGVCCTCRPTYIGNGISCLKKDMTIRVLGPLSLNLNGIRLKNLVFEGYVVLQDGRVYSAVDGLPPSLGSTMQFFKPLESVPGWLFAVTPEGTEKNGFQLTGAVFNYTATLTFSPQHVVRIRQTYKGPDAFDQIKVEIDISGRMPAFSLDLGLKHPEYEEIYTKTNPGEYRSTATHKYQLNTGEIKEVQIEQTFLFKENCHSEQETVPQRLISDRNYITYKDSILRLAAFHKLGGGPIIEDPCIKGKAQCVANSSCLIEGDAFRCACNSGFQSEYDGEEQLGCSDINECQDGTDNCHKDAICINEIGSYSCHCNSGFRGDGIHCESLNKEGNGQTVIPGSIPTNMNCQDPADLRTCSCSVGFEIQYENNQLGITCVDIDECSRLQVCSTYADCINLEGGFECRCQEGFRGDGQECEPAGCETINCPAGSVCDDSYGSPQCVCPPGFSGSPPSCYPTRPEYESSYQPRYQQTEAPLPPAQSDQCTSDSDCPQFARCLPRFSLGVYECLCEDGSSPTVTGRCPVRNQPIRTDSPSSGSIYRTCFEGRCWCPPGYSDNGQLCVKGEGAPNPSYGHLDTSYDPVDENNDPIDDPIEIPRSTLPPLIVEEDTSCHVMKNCHEYASCILADGYRCMCNPGYEGDGYNCTKSEVSCAEADICHKNAVCMPDGDQSTNYVCICSDGYVGDGNLCYPSGQCNDDTDCGDYGVCEYNEEREAHECGCRRGYTMEGSTCVPEKRSVSCDDCDPNASCVLRGNNNTCQCNDGYSGDGISCQQIVQGCDTLRNCDPNAQCLYSPDAEGYRCTCNQGFEGDGLNCQEIITCYNDPSLCDENAMCTQIDNKFTCKCVEGFFGNGTICKEAANQNEEFLLLTKGGAVIRIPFNQESPGYPINIEGQQVAVGITTDCVEGKVYWSDLGTNVIKRAKYDGTENEDFIKISGQAEGLALDWIQRQIYWTDSAQHTISTANLDTREVKVIVDQNLANPRGIAVQPYTRKLYWSDWNRRGPKIEESDLDGGRRSIVVSGNHVKLPNALTIDWERDELCWSNAGTKTIDCMFLRGSRRLPRTVVKDANYPFGVAINSGRYYWTDWQTFKIMTAPREGGAPVTSIDIPLGEDKPLGLAAVAPCPR